MPNYFLIELISFKFQIFTNAELFVTQAILIDSYLAVWAFSISKLAVITKETEIPATDSSKVKENCLGNLEV